MKQYCFGIDIGGTSIKLGLLSTKGEIIEKWEIPSRTENEGIAIIPDVTAALFAKMETLRLDLSDIKGIGVGVPAPVLKDGVVEETVNLGWGYKEVRREFTERMHLPVAVGNDANLAALGEMWQGGGKGYRNLVMVTLGTGVGGGVISEGKILTGAHGGAGEIGHIHVKDGEEASCGCGNHGCLEQYASATGIVRVAKKILKESTLSSPLRQEEVTAKTIFEQVKQGDELAILVAEQFGDCMGKALAITATIVDPEIFVIGGGVSKAGEILFTYIKKHYKNYAFFANRTVEFSLATLGNDAGIIGAVKLALEIEE